MAQKVSNAAWTETYRATTVTRFPNGTVTKSSGVLNSLNCYDNLSIATGSNGARWDLSLRRSLLTGMMSVSATSQRLEERGTFSRTVVHNDGRQMTVSLDSPYSGTSYASLPSSDPTYQSAYNEAASKLISKLMKDRQAMALVTIGEAKESCATLMNYAKEVVNSVLGFRENVKKGLKRLLKSFLQNEVAATKRRKKKRRSRRQSVVRRWTVTSTRYLSQQWLAYSYGLKPLLQDIDAFMDANFSGVLETPKKKVRAVGRSDVSATKPDIIFTPDGTSGLSVRQTAISRFKTTIKMLTLVQVSGVPLGAKKFGVMPEDFIPSVWNLIPWSFLADALTNTSDVIQAASYYLFHPTSVQLTVVKQSIQDVVTSQNPVQPSSGWRLVNESFRRSICRRKSVGITRTKILNPVPSLAFSFDPGPYQALSLSSLATLEGLKALDKQWADDTARFLASHPSLQ